jgi:hypothetical protein
MISTCWQHRLARLSGLTGPGQKSWEETDRLASQNRTGVFVSYPPGPK